MILKKSQIKQKKDKLDKFCADIEGKCNLFAILYDPNRMRILHLLKDHKEMCVTDIADVLNASVSAVSHQLRLLETCGLVSKVKQGKMVCYLLKDKKMVADLLKTKKTK